MLRNKFNAPLIRHTSHNPHTNTCWVKRNVRVEQRKNATNGFMAWPRLCGWLRVYFGAHFCLNLSCTWIRSTFLRKERKLFDLSPASTPVSQENSTDNDSSTFACVTVSDEPRMWIYCEKALNIHWSENMRRNRMKVNSTACKMPTKVIFFCTFEYRSLDSIRWAAQHIRSDYCYYYLNISFFRNGNWLFDGFTERCRHHHPMQLVESNRKWKLNDERAADENQTTNEFLL